MLCLLLLLRGHFLLRHKGTRITLQLRIQRATLFSNGFVSCDTADIQHLPRIWTAKSSCSPAGNPETDLGGPEMCAGLCHSEKLPPGDLHSPVSASGLMRRLGGLTRLHRLTPSSDLRSILTPSSDLKGSLLAVSLVTLKVASWPLTPDVCSMHVFHKIWFWCPKPLKTAKSFYLDVTLKVSLQTDSQTDRERDFLVWVVEPSNRKTIHCINLPWSCQNSFCTLLSARPKGG